MPAPEVSVVIPTHQRAERLVRAVTPLLRDPALLELVVALDDCTDDSQQIVDDLARQDPRVVRVSGAWGGDCAARQAGLEHARGAIVLFVDDDVIAEPGLVSSHAGAHATADHSTVILGYMPIALPAVRRPGQFPARKYARAYESACARFEADPSTILDSFWAGNFSLARELALTVGVRLPSWPGGYYGDKALGHHWRDIGLKAVFLRELRASHEHAPTAAEFSRAAFERGLNARRLAAPEGRRVAPDLVARLLRVAESIVWPLVVAAGWTRLWWLEDRLGSVSQRLGIWRGARCWAHHG